VSAMTKAGGRCPGAPVAPAPPLAVQLELGGLNFAPLEPRRRRRLARPRLLRKATDGLRPARPQQLTRGRPARPRSAAATRCAPSRRTRASFDARAWIGAAPAVPASGGA